jgi:transcriptional regulator with XRE-family HTH domain
VKKKILSPLEQEAAKILARNIQKLMDKNSLSKSAFAEQAGIDKGNVTKYLKEEILPSLTTLLKIAEFFDVMPSDLLDEKFDAK